MTLSPSSLCTKYSESEFFLFLSADIVQGIGDAKVESLAKKEWKSVAHDLKIEAIEIIPPRNIYQFVDSMNRNYAVNAREMNHVVLHLEIWILNLKE